MQEQSTESEIKYSVCAMIDLLGFSSHLEISGYDLRTTIGEQAVKRLQNLEAAIDLLNSESKKQKEFYPKDYRIQRVNDAIFITIDLDDILIPRIGTTNFQGVRFEAPEDSELESFEAFKSARFAQTQDATSPLVKFLGFVSRVHILINKLEANSFFPGAKTVVSTGFRRPFKDDHFSANFSLSNAYLAEKNLHGSSFYVESAIMQIISLNKFGKNLIRFAHFKFIDTPFDCFSDEDNIDDPTNSTTVILEPIDLKLFRKNYQFRELNPSPLAYLQTIPIMYDYLEGLKSPILSNIYYRHIFNAIRIGVNKGNTQPRSFLFNMSNDISTDISIMFEWISTGKSEMLEKLAQEQFDLEYQRITEEGKKIMKEWLEQPCEVELEKINIEDFQGQIYNFSEQMLTSLIPILEGDINQLDYQQN